MLPRVPAVDHNFVEAADKSGSVRPHVRPADWKKIEDLLGLLARAIQQLHTYPATSPLCTSAIDACSRALAALDTRDQLIVRVTPSELVVDDVPVGKGGRSGRSSRGGCTRRALVPLRCCGQRPRGRLPGSARISSAAVSARRRR